MESCNAFLFIFPYNSVVSEYWYGKQLSDRQSHSDRSGTTAQFGLRFIYLKSNSQGDYEYGAMYPPSQVGCGENSVRACSALCKHGKISYLLCMVSVLVLCIIFTKREEISLTPMVLSIEIKQLTWLKTRKRIIDHPRLCVIMVYISCHSISRNAPNGWTIENNFNSRFRELGLFT